MKFMYTNEIDKINFLKIRGIFEDSISLKKKSLNDPKLINSINNTCKLIKKTFSNNHKLFLAGNGGSAADAQHIAAEFVCKFEKERKAIPALALTTDTSVLTAIGNDMGYEFLFSRQLEALGSPGDLFIGITTSGKSKNIINAFNKCKELKISKVALCGSQGNLSDLVDYAIEVPSSNTARIQECHILIGHILCSYLENIVANG